MVAHDAVERVLTIVWNCCSRSRGTRMFMRTVGLDRTRTKIGLANLTYNVKRLIVLKRWAALAA